jgi:polysaccharide biosynthesis transport protein
VSTPPIADSPKAPDADSGSEDPYDDEIREAWRIIQRVVGALRRRWYVALLVTVLGSAAVGVRLALLPPRYESRGLLQVGLNLEAAEGDDIRFATTSARALKSQVLLLSSEGVTQKATALTLGRELPSGQARDEAVEEFLEHVEVKPLRDSFLVEVHGWDGDPKLAAARVNNLLEVFLATSEEFTSSRFHAEEAQARQREGQAREALQQAEERREAFLSEWGEISFQGRSQALAVRVNELETRAARVDTERATIAAETSRVAPNLVIDTDMPEVMVGRLGFVEDSLQLLEPLHDLHSRLLRQQAILEPTHPEVQALQQELAAQTEALRGLLRSLSEGKLEELRSRYYVLENERRELTDLLAGLQRERFDLAERQADHERLQREVAWYEAELEANRGNQWRAEGRSQLHLAAAVLAPGEVSVEPVSPFTPTAILLTLLGMGFLGTVVVVVWDHLDDTFRGHEDLQRELKLPLLAKIPVHEREGENPTTQLWLAGVELPTLLGEAFRLLRTNLTFAMAGVRKRTLLVTSATLGDGKTFTALNLAAALGTTDGPTLLIEGDLRRPRLSKLLEVGKVQGLAEVLAGLCTLEEAVMETPFPGLNLLPCGTSPPSPADLLARGHVERVLEAARERYATVLIDSPPVLGIADTSLFAPHSDGVVMVVRVGHSRRRDVEAALYQLHQNGVTPAGLVINGVEPSEGYGYGYGYGKVKVESDTLSS